MACQNLVNAPKSVEKLWGISNECHENCLGSK